MTLRQSISTDIETVFLNSDEFAEEVTYYPRSGGSRTILAIVEREPPSLFDQAGNVVMVAFLVWVKNDKTDGILATELNTGNDQIELPERIGKLPRRRCSVERLIDHDGGMLQLALR